MKQRLKALAVVFLGLMAAGLATRHTIEDRLWGIMREEEPALQLEALEAAMGQGITLGLLGGFRALVANGLWLSANAAWMDSDRTRTQTYIGLTTTVDPRPLFFWINGSRIIGYDIPHWRIEARGGEEQVPQTVQDQFVTEQAQDGIRLLTRGLDFHPNDPLLLIEIANLHDRRLKDLKTATEFYRIASEQPRAPAYAARVYAEFLRRQGRQKEAYEFYKELLPTLPKDINHMPWVVYDRIRDLEEELQIPAAQRYVGSRPSLE